MGHINPVNISGVTGNASVPGVGKIFFPGLDKRLEKWGESFILTFRKND
jgi:hypothetical protein